LFKNYDIKDWVIFLEKYGQPMRLGKFTPGASEDDKKVVGRARRLQRFMSQPFAVAEQFTGMKGAYVKLDETISSFERLCAGEFDHYPEQAFFMCGGADDIAKNAERIAKA
jgi:F-type H+-transporting ATPase subunit beta